MTVMVFAIQKPLNAKNSLFLGIRIVK